MATSTRAGTAQVPSDDLAEAGTGSSSSRPCLATLQYEVPRDPLGVKRGAVVDQDLHLQCRRPAGVGLDQGIGAGGDDVDLARAGDGAAALEDKRLVAGHPGVGVDG